MKPHIIFVGFRPDVVDSVDWKKNLVSIIVHEFIDDQLDESVRSKLAGIGVLKIPHSNNLEEAYTDAMPQIEKLAEELIERHGPAKAFIALYEHSTLPAALCREKFSVPGTSVATATLCRDKVKMKQSLKGSGIRYPLFKSVHSKTSLAEIKEFTQHVPGKIVLKPRAQAASEGIFIFEHEAALFQHIAEHGLQDRYQLEEFIEGQLCLFDGIVRDKKLMFFSVSKYTATCFEYIHQRKPIASITTDDVQLSRKASLLTSTILERVGLENGTFNCEAFLLPNNEWVFLEIASRFGGAGVVPLMKQMYGVDLIKECILADRLEPSEIEEPIHVSDYNFSSAWMYFPVPKAGPCKVTAVTGLDDLPNSIVASDTVRPGQGLNQAAGAFLYAGRFFVKAKTSAGVKNDCEMIAKNYCVNVVSAQ
jgi:biotin carboxylase